MSFTALSAFLIAGSASQAQPPSGAVAATVKQRAASHRTADAPSTTAAGNSFIVPDGWSVAQKGNASILEAPEGNSWIALVDVKAMQHDAAIAEVWAAYRPSANWSLQGTTSSPDKDGWTDQRIYSYRTSPNEHRTVTAGAMRHGDRWMAWIHDVDNAVAEKRSGAISLISDNVLPKGYARETFAGRKVNILDETRIKELTDFIQRSQQALGVPGASLGLIQDGKIVFAGGFGLKELGRTEKPDADTLYLLASVTKSMTTLMLGKLVDEKRLAWDTPVTSVFPQFKLGDPDTSRKVRIRHLVCACTGLPRQDLNWLLEFKNSTPATTLAMLGATQPTSQFGEMFQYSNLLAAAGGFVGGHVAFPGKELGEAYDDAMQSLVFDPLGMTSTTFSFKHPLSVNHASGHAFDIDGKPTLAVFDINYAIVPLRPAGGAWSSVNDLLKLVAMELANGNLPDGSRYISADVLADRQAPNAWFGKDDSYGMGLMVSATYGVRVVYHPGSMFGYREQMLWLPEYGVGAVLLTNADQGDTLWSAFPRKFLEILFDGKPQADNDVQVAAKAVQARIATERKLLDVPPDSEVVATLGNEYSNSELGDIAVRRAGNSVIFDFGEWASPVASRRNPDGTTSFVTIAPSFSGKEFVMSDTDGKRVLKLRDAQHEYVFREK